MVNCDVLPLQVGKWEVAMITDEDLQNRSGVAISPKIVYLEEKKEKQRNGQCSSNLKICDCFSVQLFSSSRLRKNWEWSCGI